MVRRTWKTLSQTERRQLRRDRLNRLLPNALTMLGLCCGLTAIRYGLDERWQLCVVLIAAAAVLDGLDGRMARLMGGQTELGGQLDSLVDAVSFGVAPIMIIFLCSLTYAGGLGWAISVLFVVCCVLRLARFNITSSDTNLPQWTNNYFTGVPSPAAAGMVLLPLVLHIETSWSFLLSAWLTLPWTLLIACLMIAPIPTHSFKRFRVPRKLVVVYMAGIALLAAAMITEPWLTFSAITVLYSASIPFSIHSYKKTNHEEALRSAGTNDVGEKQNFKN